MRDGELPKPDIHFIEASLLGTLMANYRSYERVVDILRPEFFFDPLYGEIFGVIARLVDSGRPVDAVILGAHFGDRVVLNADGSETMVKALLAHCLTAFVGLASAREYAQRIAEHWHRRQLIDIGVELVTEARGPIQEAEDGSYIYARNLHEAAEARMFAAANMLTDAGAAVEVGDAVARAIAAAEKAAKQRGGIVGVGTGLESLDALTGGFRPGQLILLGARPSMGKTAAALAMSAGAAAAGSPVLFASLEMDPSQIGARLVSGLSGLPGEYADRGMRRDRDPLGRFTYHDLAQADWDAMVRVQRRVSDPATFPLVIDECRQRTMASIRTRARQMQRKRGLAMIVIDYLGLLRVPELKRAENKVLEVSRISSDAKALALELGVPVVLLSQLNRALESREDRRPRLSDLRDSGSLEQDADIVMFLHREHYYLKREPIKRRPTETEEKLADRTSAWLDECQRHAGRAQMLIDKQRMGPIGVADLAFNESNGWISNLRADGAD